MSQTNGEEEIALNPAWAPSDADKIVPNAARVYDYWLDGGHNFAADRALANKVAEVMPQIRDVVRIQRAFLRRAVLFMVKSGIRQFLDIGSGIPTVGNVHEIAQKADPECRIVYVDKESIAVAHCEHLLADNDRAGAIRADLRDVEVILHHPQTKRLLDLDQPVGLLMLWVLHFVPDSWDPVSILGRYRDRLSSGSYLAVSQGTMENNLAGQAETAQLYQHTLEPVYARSHAEILRFFTGFELVEPGLVGCGLWRATGPGDVSTNAAMNSVSYGGVGRKP